MIARWGNIKMFLKKGKKTLADDNFPKKKTKINPNSSYPYAELKVKISLNFYFPAEVPQRSMKMKIQINFYLGKCFCKTRDSAD